MSTVVAPRRSRTRGGPVIARVVIALAVIAAVAAMSDVPAARIPIIVAYGVLCIRWSAERVLAASVFLTLALDDPSSRPFRDLWHSPVQDIGFTWFSNVSTAVHGIPIKASPLLLVSIVTALRCIRGRTGPNCRPAVGVRPIPRLHQSALVAGVGALLFWSLWGVVRHGDTQQLFYQVTPFLLLYSMLVIGIAIGSVEMAHRLRKVILVAATYRAGLLFFLWVTRIRHLPQLPQYTTSHTDSAIWAAAIIIVFAQYLEHPSRRTRRALMLALPFFGYCLVINNRRLAWVILLVSLLYVVLASVGRPRARLAKVMPVLAPLMIVYTLAGLVAPPSTVFAPIQAIESVDKGDDSSSQTRVIENYNLVFTMRESSPLGTGFGHPYIEVIPGGDSVAKYFPNYIYQPHNSLFGYLMWMGPIGLVLALGPLCLATRSAHRARGSTSDPFVRMTCVLAIAMICAYYLEGYGDFGLQTQVNIVLAAVVGGVCVGFELDELKAHHVSTIPSHRRSAATDSP